jgi:hypothetical protein
MEEENLGFAHGSVAQLGGVAEMGDDVHVEFEEENVVVPTPSIPSTWKLLARYWANFKPNAKTMFTHFAQEV